MRDVCQRCLRLPRARQPTQRGQNDDTLASGYVARMSGSDDESERPRGPFSLTPIGWVSSPYRRRFGTPQQASAIDSDSEAVLELDPELIPEQALCDLAGVERLWVLSFLHRSGTWGPSVRPPRGARVRRSLFATRSPDRPNPIGLSVVKLVRIEGTKLHVRGVDLLDGTPILDLKPYIPYADAFPDARAGWIDEISPDELQFAKRPPEPEPE
jgi:tRNA-Thr(GGU) m(6)t(6)A37 methyltransferase TsaA